MKFDKTGKLISQKINYKVRHDEQTEELIDNYINDKCIFQIKFSKSGDCIFNKKEEKQ